MRISDWSSDVCSSDLGVSPSTWRVNFIGSQKRGTKRATLKDLTKERCRQLGMKPQNDDEADAIGILTHAADSLGLSPPGTANEVLRPPLGSEGACKQNGRAACRAIVGRTV